MLNFDDVRWEQLSGGYRTPLDARPLLRALEAQGAAGWAGLWKELHHQGDVGEASYAAVPHLVRIYLSSGVPDWNAYALVGTIELARGREANPQVPAWAAESYHQAIGRLAERGLEDLSRVQSPEAIRSILGLLAIWKGARTYGRVLLELTEDEVLELEEQRDLG